MFNKYCFGAPENNIITTTMNQENLHLDPAKFSDCTRKLFKDAGATPEEIEAQAKAAYDRASRSKSKNRQELKHH